MADALPLSLLAKMTELHTRGQQRCNLILRTNHVGLKVPFMIPNLVHVF